MAIYSWSAFKQMWFSMAMLIYQSVHKSCKEFDFDFIPRPWLLQARRKRPWSPADACSDGDQGQPPMYSSVGSSDEERCGHVGVVKSKLRYKNNTIYIYKTSKTSKNIIINMLFWGVVRYPWESSDIFYEHDIWDIQSIDQVKSKYRIMVNLFFY